MSIKVVFSFIWDVLILKDSPEPIQWVGAGLIVIGSVSAVLIRHMSQKKKELLLLD
jgi:drug/metabolite transporter (DMT)-like permease